MTSIVTLGEICRPKQWKTLSKAEMADSGFPVYGANGKIGFAETFTHREPTILIGCRGSCGSVVVSDPMAYVNGNAMALDDLDQRRVDLFYLFHYLSYRGFRDVTTGTSQPQIIGLNLRRVEVPLPPLAEQRRIAAILDKADALRAKRREAIAKLDQLLQSVFLDMFGDPATNSKRLPTARLGDLGEWRSGGTPSRSNPSFFHGEIPWYSSGELNSPYVGRSNEHISDGAVAASAVKVIRPGSLMVGMYDTAAFKSSITTIPAACNQAIAFSLLDANKCETVYVYQALQVGKEHFKRLQRGVRQKNLNLSMIRETEIPLPPVEQQRKFVRLFAAVLGQHDRQSGHADRVDILFRALQRRAFEGFSNS